MRKTGKKGSTLAELCVVLALIATASAMIASFSMLISARTNLSTARLNAMNDLELVESVTEGWMSRMVEQGIEASLDGYTLESGSYDLSFSPGNRILSGTLPDGDITVQLDQVSAINYEVLRENGNVLCICTVKLEMPTLASNDTKEYSSRTFCVNLNVGDTYGGGQE